MKGLKIIPRKDRIRAWAALHGPVFRSVLEVFDRCTCEESIDLLEAVLIADDPYYEDRIIRIAEVTWITSLSKSTIYRLVDAGKFPKPFDLIGIGKRPAVGWENGKVRQWLRERAKE